MKSHIVAPQAEADLQQIWRYLLGAADLAVTNRIQSELVDAFEELAQTPGQGHRPPDLTNRDVLFFTLYQYLIVYRRAEVVEIAAVLHSKRDVKRLLKPRLSKKLE